MRWWGMITTLAIVVSLLLAALMMIAQQPGLVADAQIRVYQRGVDGISDIYAEDVDMGISHNLTSAPPFNAGPVISSDGMYIAFISARDGNMEIYVMERTGRNPRNLSQHPGRDYLPFWSDDSASVLFMSSRDGVEAPFIAHIHTGELRSISDEEMTNVAGSAACRSGRQGAWSTCTRETHTTAEED